MVTPEFVKLTMDNTQVLNNDAFVSDEELTIELINLEYGLTKETLGIPLLPSEIKCRACGGKFLLRSDRPARITLYTEALGAVAATHFYKLNTAKTILKGANVFSIMGTIDQGMAPPFNTMRTGFLCHTSYHLKKRDLK